MICDSLKLNDNILYLYYDQFGLKIPQKLTQLIKHQITENIKKHLNISYDEFRKSKLNNIRGSKNLKNIDSIYRNRM
jgi:hypothetical protein